MFIVVTGNIVNCGEQTPSDTIGDVDKFLSREEALSFIKEGFEEEEWEFYETPNGFFLPVNEDELTDGYFFYRLIVV
jgi:hypothetical protein